MEQRPSHRWRRVAAILFLILSPVYLLFVVGVVLPLGALASYVGNRRRAWRVRRAMVRAGRLMTLRDAEQRLRTACGTLIVDCPLIGWRFTQLWWTPDDVARTEDELPDAPSGGDDPLSAWGLASRPFYERYLDERSGSAKLVAWIGGAKRGERLRRRVPGVRLVRFSSGPCRCLPNAGGEKGAVPA